MSLDPVFVAGWIVILGAGVAWELIAIFRRKRGDTLSELTWSAFRKSNALRFAVGGLLVWATIHLLFFGVV